MQRPRRPTPRNPKPFASELLFGEGATAYNKMFLQWCRDELVLSFIFVQRFVSWDRTRLRKGTTAETQTLCTRRQNGLRGQERFQFITSVLPDRLKEKINLARARWSSLVDKSCRATWLQVVDIPQVFHWPPEQVCNA